MLSKVVVLFLLAMVLVAMVGKVIFPGALDRQVKRRLTLRRPAACLRCGRPKIGRTCDCDKKG